MTVVVYARKAKVIERRRTQRIEDAGGSCTCPVDPVETSSSRRWSSDSVMARAKETKEI